MFQRFLIGLPRRLEELRRIVPSSIPMDYTYESVRMMQEWFVPFVYDAYLEGGLTHYMSPEDFYAWRKENGYADLEYFNFLVHCIHPSIRSLASDIAIYLSEILRTTGGMSDLYWTEGFGKLDCAGAGFPCVFSEKIGHKPFSSNKKFNLTFLMLNTTNIILAENGNTFFNDKAVGALTAKLEIAYTNEKECPFDWQKFVEEK
ncbi:hypothetical protein H6769_05220 [Candidatus Peribacteria bacterium]|nr:hypothetical protein [Candidatus Peribacteria bacterium]